VRVSAATPVWRGRRVGYALADLLDALGDDVGGLDEGVRWQARESCRLLLAVDAVVLRVHPADLGFEPVRARNAAHAT
jgi:hypothetical protein